MSISRLLLTVLLYNFTIVPLFLPFASFIHWSGVQFTTATLDTDVILLKYSLHHVSLNDFSLSLSSVAAMAAGSLRSGLSAEVWHKSPPPHHRLPQHGCYRRGWPRERAEQSTMRDEIIQKPRKQRWRQSEEDEQKTRYENIGQYRWGWDNGNQSWDLAKPCWAFIFIWI